MRQLVFRCAKLLKMKIKICTILPIDKWNFLWYDGGPRTFGAARFACQLTFCTKFSCDFCAKLLLALSRNACYNKEKLRKGSRKAKVKNYGSDYYFHSM